MVKLYVRMILEGKLELSEVPLRWYEETQGLLTEGEDIW